MHVYTKDKIALDYDSNTVKKILKNEIICNDCKNDSSIDERIDTIECYCNDCFEYY